MGSSSTKSQKLYKTGDVAEHAGVTRHVIHLYLTLGLIEPVDQTPSGHNLFDASVFRRLDLIKRLQKKGYTLRDIKQVFFKDRR